MVVNRTKIRLCVVTGRVTEAEIYSQCTTIADLLVALADTMRTVEILALYSAQKPKLVTTTPVVVTTTTTMAHGTVIVIVLVMGMKLSVPP